MERRTVYDVPIWRKMCLTFEEAAAYSHIGENKLREIARDPRNSDFVLHNGTHTMFKRDGFEKYVAGLSHI